MNKKIALKVQSFYNTTPFPNFDLNRFNTTNDLENAAKPLARSLDKSIPTEATVIDIGTGTGQLAAFLSLKRDVYGIDFSDSSLKKAQALKDKLNLKTFHLKKVDIMDAQSISALNKQFDYVLCFGVLHHTKDAHQAFLNILKLVKPGGYIAIGLYNRYGRILLKIRRFLAKTIFKNNQPVKNWFIKMQISNLDDKERVRGWWNDQYHHPHETTHTVGEVLNWFKQGQVQYYLSLPPLSKPKSDDRTTNVWHRNPTPSRFRRAWKQLLWIWTIHRDGGYWISLGKKL